MAGRILPGHVLALDATVVIAHGEKEHARPTFKHTFGFHPIGCWLDNTGEFLAAILRPGNAGSNTAADHMDVLDAALAQIPDEHRHGVSILVRADTAGATKRSWPTSPPWPRAACVVDQASISPLDDVDVAVERVA